MIVEVAGLALSVGGAIAAVVGWIVTRAKTEFRVAALETRVDDLEQRVDAEIKILSDRLLEVIVRLERIAGGLEAQRHT